MNSRFLKDALDFVLSHNHVRKWIDSRDQSKLIQISELKIKFFRYDKTTKTYLLKVGIDYQAIDNGAPEFEDVVVTVTWDPKNLYVIRRIQAVKEL